MTKAVLTIKISPVYDDLPEVRYHFPKTYLRQLIETVGDRVVTTNHGGRPLIDRAAAEGKSILPWHGWKALFLIQLLKITIMQKFHPHPKFLDYHRREIFKG